VGLESRVRSKGVQVTAPLPILTDFTEPRDVTRDLGSSPYRFGSPVAAPRHTDELHAQVKTLTEQLAIAQGVAAGLERELAASRTQYLDELTMVRRLFGESADLHAEIARLHRYALSEQRCRAAWERHCAELLVERSHLKAQIVELNEETRVVDVRP
jgi:hypothetical protein